MSPALTAVIKAVVLPPGFLLLLALAAVPLWGRHRYMATGLLACAFLLLYLFATPAFARRLAAALEGGLDPMPSAQVLQRARAIVVPGCDRYAHAPEYGGRDAVSACTLARLQHAARLHAATGLPILLSGGRVFGEEEAEAELMDRALRQAFNIAPAWLETRSRSTAENARYSAVMLKTQDIDTVVLVTHAVHMPRAAGSCRRAGLTVIPAPTHFYSVPDARPGITHFLPSMGALSISHLALHELVGIAWYNLRGV